MYVDPSGSLFFFFSFFFCTCTPECDREPSRLRSLLVCSFCYPALEKGVFVVTQQTQHRAVMGTGGSKPQHSPLHIGVGEAHAAHTNIPGLHHEHHHTGPEGVVHNVVEWSHELFNRKVQEGDTLWYLSERYLGDATKWPYLQSACELDRDPHHLQPGRLITHHCINQAKEDAKHHHYVNPSGNPLHRLAHDSHQESLHHGSSEHGHGYHAPSKNPLHRMQL